MQKFKMADKNGRKTIIGKTRQYTGDTLCVKNFADIALSHTVIKINAFYAEIQDGCQK